MAKNSTDSMEFRWVVSDKAVQEGVQLINKLINTDGAHVFLTFNEEDGTERTIRLTQNIGFFSYIMCSEES